MPNEKYLTALIVDDEQKAIDNLWKLINAYCPAIKIIDSAAGAESASLLVNSLRPDVVFLDIAMPKKNGFELLRTLEFMPLVVFVTAYEKYALNAIKASAVDFLLKPVDITELKNVENKLLKIQAARTATRDSNYSSIIGNLVNMLQNPGTIKHIALPGAEGYDIINVNDVLYLEGENNYTFFYFQKKPRIVVSKTLKEYEDLLEESGFFRIHKSSIINLQHLRKVTSNDSVAVVMSNEQVLPVSRRRAAELLDRVKQHIS